MKLAAGLLLALVLTSCGEAKNCQNTCRKLFAESECGIQLQGRTPEDAIASCISTCQAALQQAGELCVDVGEPEPDCYEPEEKRPANDPPELLNDARTAAWMDCVWERVPLPGHSAGCDELDPAVGYCAPTSF